MMVGTFNGTPSLTNVSEDMDLIVFYNELSSPVRSIPKHNLLIISGDTNAQKRKNINKQIQLTKYTEMGNI